MALYRHALQNTGLGEGLGLQHGNCCYDEDSNCALPDDNVIQLMRKRLPQYVVNCCLAAGYDDQGVISTMNTSESNGNSISKIEDFIETLIEKNHSGGLQNMNNDLTPPTPFVRPFKFPPGHQERICKFVQEIKANKRECQNGNSVKKKRPRKSRIDEEFMDGVSLRRGLRSVLRLLQTKSVIA